MKTAVIGICVAIVAYLVLAISSSPPFVQALIAIPGSAGLILALWSALKSEVPQEIAPSRSPEPSSAPSIISSHMIDTAFDKHVEFCERYMAKANEGLAALFREGPTEKSLALAAELFQLRRTYILWEVEETGAFLDKFERALRKIGADRYYLKSIEASPERSVLVTKLFETFQTIIQLEPFPGSPTAETAINLLISQLRDHMGINEVVQLQRLCLAQSIRSASLSRR